MEPVSEEMVKKWLSLAQKWRTEKYSCEMWNLMDDLRSFLDDLHAVIKGKNSPRSVLQEFPSVGKLLGALIQIPVIQTSAHSSEFQEDSITRKAVSWAQSQVRNMTICGCPDPNNLSIGEYLGYTAQETTETFQHKLVESICHDLSSFKCVKWNSKISDLEPVVDVKGSTLRGLSEMIIPLMDYPSILPLVEALLLSSKKATDLFSSNAGALFIATNCLSPQFLSLCGQMASSRKHAGTGLSYSAKIALWHQHQESFEEEVLAVIEAVSFSKSVDFDQELKDYFQSSDLILACTESVQLGLAAEQLLSEMLRKTMGDQRIWKILEMLVDYRMTRGCRKGKSALHMDGLEDREKDRQALVL
ncbi:uncharacterized protein LOC116620108 isoform X2 [Nematostella vectensis]|uniref:uncharacterized protein LOC116620108 isoform X2 n=1 Tax=Nematostella vectensis TaxID=45351 RepID=UPI002076DDEE|nr:uncharacterized protein LOC116620108 isoform X2 [Nematostella vectensis]